MRLHVDCVLNQWFMCLVALAMFSCASLAGCGKGTTSPPRGDAPPGSGCQSSNECQGGLSCVDGACTYERCNSAHDPDQWCKEQNSTDTDALDLVCERGTGDCVEIFGEIGESCTRDAQCNFGLVCHEQRCVETCVSSASCREEDTACLPREDAASGSVCQTSPSCISVEEPDAFCQDVLGVAERLAQCNLTTGECEVVQLWDGAFCRFDAQCISGVCEDRECTSTCESDDDCYSMKVCRPRLGESMVQVCQNLTCLDELDPDNYCVQEIGSQSAFCSFSGECELAEQDYGVFVMIEDTGSGAACESRVAGVFEPGTDLMYIFLFQDLEGGDSAATTTTEVLFVEQGTSEVENTLVSYEHLSDPVDLELFSEGDGCYNSVDKAPTPETVYSMGCGGRMVVNFSRGGQPVRLNEFSEIVIGDYGPACANAASEREDGDSFDVFLCTNTNAVANSLDFSSCTHQLVIEDDGVVKIAYSESSL